MANSYATVAEFKNWVTVRGGAVTADTTDDSVIDDILESVSRKIDELTGRKFWKNTVAETRYFQAEETYYLETEDLVSVTTLSVDYSNIRSYTDLVAADFELGPPNATLDGKPYTEIFIAPTSTAYFPVFKVGGSRGIKISGIFGWPSIPANIKDDCLQIAQNVWMARSGQVSSGKITITAAGVVIRPEDIPPYVIDDLMTMRIYR